MANKIKELQCKINRAMVRMALLGIVLPTAAQTAKAQTSPSNNQTSNIVTPDLYKAISQSQSNNNTINYSDINLTNPNRSIKCAFPNLYITYQDFDNLVTSLYKQCTKDFIQNYLQTAKSDIEEINKCPKGSRSYYRTIQQRTGKYPANKTLFCAEIGLHELSRFAPKFILDSIYPQLSNPNRSLSVIDDIRKIAQKYSPKDAAKFFLGYNCSGTDKKGNSNRRYISKSKIYKNILEYNKKYNPQNDPKIFLCVENNYNRTHFVAMVYDGKNISRISFNNNRFYDDEKIEETKSNENYMKITYGPADDITGME